MTTMPTAWTVQTNRRSTNHPSAPRHRLRPRSRVRRPGHGTRSGDSLGQALPVDDRQPRSSTAHDQELGGHGERCPLHGARRHHHREHCKASERSSEEDARLRLGRGSGPLAGVRHGGRLDDRPGSGGQGSSRRRRPRNSTGDPSLSRHRYPVRGLQLVPPDTSRPLTQRRTSPLMARM